ncbi:leukotriene B4 receptor 2b [Brachyhypopomus gauderio]|uniref:leukotriene B4 receptor 2b n=1 Tax=Brachyhypopomus gauderio TaxID=698409 RepID=UPI00404251ED
MSGNSTSQDLLQDVSFGIGTSFLAVAILLGVPGNVFIIWSILARARKRSVTTLIILHLACADGGIMCLSLFFLVYLAKQSWVFGQAMCKLLFYLCNTNMYASIMLITLMSVHRLMAVRWPLRMYALARKRIILGVLIALWVLVFTLALPAFIFREEVKDRTNARELCLCLLNHTHYQYAVFQFTMETVVGFLFPYGIIVSSYVCIIRRLRRTKFKRKAHRENLILAIIVAFAIFWLPYHINNIMQMVTECMSENDHKKWLINKLKSSRRVIATFPFISSCANPVLYTFAGRSYIKTEGLSFMARLFDRTALDINARKNGHSNTDRGVVGLKTSDAWSPTAATTVKIQTMAHGLGSDVARKFSNENLPEGKFC